MTLIGLNGYGVDTAALAIDYRSMGFRECASEVARYTATVEGMDLHDPLRLRLLGHLQCYCSQRESAAKASLHSHHATSGSAAPWGGMQAPSQYAPSAADQCSGLGLGSAAAIAGSNSLVGAPTYTELQSRMSSHHAAAGSDRHASLGLGGAGGAVGGSSSSCSGSAASHASYVTSAGTMGAGGVGAGAGFMLQGMYNHPHHQFAMPLAAMNTVLSPSGQPGQHPLGKPYRPWGLELAY